MKEIQILSTRMTNINNNNRNSNGGSKQSVEQQIERLIEFTCTMMQELLELKRKVNSNTTKGDIITNPKMLTDAYAQVNECKSIAS